MGLLGLKRAGAAPPPASTGRASREINGGEFVGQNLTGYDLTNRTVRDANFDHSIMSRADLARSHFVNCTFNAATLSKASLKHARFENCEFNRVMLDGADAELAVFGEIAAAAPDGAGTSFSHAVLAGANFTGATLNRAILSDVEATGTNFRKARLQGAVFDRCVVGGAVFVSADVEGADFSLCDEARKVLPPAALRVVNFYKKIDQATLDALVEAHERWILSSGREGERLVLNVTDFAGHKLRGRNLSGADLRQCKLDRASFQDSLLIAADLRGALLDGTLFRACDLRGAKLDTKSITKVRLQDSRI